MKFKREKRPHSMKKLRGEVKRIALRWLRFWVWVFKQFKEDKCIIRCSSLTFTSLLAVVPLSVVVFSALSIFPFFKSGARQFQDYLFDNLIPSSGDMVQKYVIQFETSAHKLPVFGFIFLFITAIMMMVTIENTLNDIWKVRYRRRISGSILLYWALLTLGPILLSLSLFVSSYIRSLEWLHPLASASIPDLLVFLPFLCAFLAFGFLYLVVPHCTVKIRHAAAGAFVGALLFEGAKWLFGYYVTNFPTYSLLYGALATIPIFLLWIYISWIVFLVGAEVVNGLRLNQAERSASDMNHFYLAYRIMYSLYSAQRRGVTLSLVRLLASIPQARVGDTKATMRQLRACKFIHTAGDDMYVLSSDLHQLTLHDFYLKLGCFMPESLDSIKNDGADKALQGLLNEVHRKHEEVLNVPMVKLFAAAK